jgi:UDP-glucuronate decarboxylase
VTGPINLGNPVEIAVRDLAQAIVDKTGSASGLEHRELPPDDPKQRQPDISRARELLGWQPKVALGDGLERTINYFRNLAIEE